jgi:hypothetical protein
MSRKVPMRTTTTPIFPKSSNLNGAVNIGDGGNLSNAGVPETVGNGA